MPQHDGPHKLGLLLLDIGSMLMSSGASTHRIRITINRIAEPFGYQPQLFITPTAILLTLTGTSELFNSLKQVSSHGVNFRVVSGISRMSWRVKEENWSLDQVSEEIDRLASLPHYPRWLVVPMVALAAASFCRVFDGNLQEMVVTFMATFLGLIVRQEAQKLKFVPLLCVFFAAVTASLISGFFILRGGGVAKAGQFAASVLFLVPGVPLINSFVDLLDGNAENFVERGINGLATVFAVALGFSVAIILYAS